MVGDLVGFVASIYLRGIPFVSLPTTLLAQVDSCIGGKTGVNSGAGKNSIGAFIIRRWSWPIPIRCELCPIASGTRVLPRRSNTASFETPDAGLAAGGDVPPTVRQSSSPAISRFKAEIVAADEKERIGQRSLLNFGHTIGHAIEHAAGYGQILHGEAISLGMIAAAHVSVRRAGLSLGEGEQFVSALQAHHLPVRSAGRSFRARKSSRPWPATKNSSKAASALSSRMKSAGPASLTMSRIEDLRAAVGKS